MRPPPGSGWFPFLIAASVRFRARRKRSNSDVHSAKEQGKKDQLIYNQDTAWLRECDLLIAECTCPSLGVGYELAYAERYSKPCYVFYRRSQVQLSAMITGDPYYNVIPYETKEELFEKIREILS